MKLKEAVKIARKMREVAPKPIQYIAADPNGDIWTFTSQPYIYDYARGWESDEFINNRVGKYTGAKHWSNTCRKV